VEWIQLAQDRGRWQTVVSGNEPAVSGATELVHYCAYTQRAQCVCDVSLLRCLKNRLPGFSRNWKKRSLFSDGMVYFLI
jgi:hypothetical protein